MKVLDIRSSFEGNSYETITQKKIIYDFFPGNNQIWFSKISYLIFVFSMIFHIQKNRKKQISYFGKISYLIFLSYFGLKGLTE